MKRHFVSFIRFVPLVIAGLLFAASGCASTIRLRMIDAKTGLSLTGVSAVWREDSYDLILGRFQKGPTNLAPSDDSGIITINGVHNRRVGRLVFSHPGYTPVYGAYSGGSLEISEAIKPPPLSQERFILEEPRTVIGTSNGCFLVKIPRRGPTTSPTRH